MLLRDAPDRHQQLARGGRKSPADVGRRRRADGALGAAHHDERRAGGEQPPHRRLTGALVDGRQRSGERRGPERAEAERIGAHEVVAQHPRGAGHQHAGVPPPRERQRVANARAARHPCGRDVDQIGRREAHLGIDVRALGHAHARGWNRRYIRKRVADGKCV